MQPHVLQCLRMIASNAMNRERPKRPENNKMLIAVCDVSRTYCVPRVFGQHASKPSMPNLHQTTKTCCKWNVKCKCELATSLQILIEKCRTQSKQTVAAHPPPPKNAECMPNAQEWQRNRRTPPRSLNPHRGQKNNMNVQIHELGAKYKNETQIEIQHRMFTLQNENGENMANCQKKRDTYKSLWTHQ